jgi:Domain of unknown function (DUF6285)
MTDVYDRPTATELLTAVRHFLSTTLSDEVSGQLAFHCRVAANMLAIVERELASQQEHAIAHRARLDRLGMADDAELAAAIASGAVDDRYPDVNAALRDAVWDKLAVANPKYVRPFDDPRTAADQLFRRSDDST